MQTRENVAIAHDEIRDLIANGWTPPAAVAERYRHLLRSFYQHQGYSCLPLATLDANDIRAIGAIIGLFDDFGIEVPEPPTVAEAA